MRPKKSNLALSGFCLFITLIFPNIVQSAILMGDLPGGNIGSITLTGENQYIDGGSGNFTIKATNLLAEQWQLTVHGTRLTQVNGSGLKLPVGSLVLNPPILQSDVLCPICSIGDGPWVIDDESAEPIKIIEGTFLPLGLLLGSCPFTFNPYPFRLSIHPGEKMIDNGFTSATYQTTLTWTLISVGL
jgi:hypothetical protein